MTRARRNNLGHKGDRMRSYERAKAVDVQKCGVRFCDNAAQISLPIGEGVYKHRCFEHLAKKGDTSGQVG